MLGGQQRRRHEHRHLLPVLHGLEGGPHRHLGLPEPDVAADEPVHRPFRLHVGTDIGDGPGLIRRLGELEPVFQLLLPRGVRPEGMACHLQPLPVELDELDRHLVDGGPGLGPRLAPLGSAQPVERRCLSPAVGGEGLDLIRRQVELVVSPVLEQEVVPRRPVDRPRDHPLVPRHPVLPVHDVIPRRQVVEETVDRTGPGPGRPMGPPPPRDVGLGQDRHLGRRHHETPVQGGDHDPDPTPTKIGLAVTGLRNENGHRQPFLGQHGSQPVGRSDSLGTDRDRIPGLGQLTQAGRQPRPVTMDRFPSVGGHARSGRRRRHRHQTQHRRRAPIEQPLIGHVQPGKGIPTVLGTLIDAPRDGEGTGQRRLLVVQLGGPVAHPPRIDEHHPAAVTQEIGQHPFVIPQPWQPRLHTVEQLPLGQPLPLGPTPRCLPHQVPGPLPDLLGG